MVPVVSEFRAAQAGVSDCTITIPNSVALANVHLFQQALVLDASANVDGLVASNGSAVTTGIR